MIEAAQQERIIRSDSAAVCVNMVLGIWRPVKLILTEERLVCQQGHRVVLSIPLSAISGVEVVRTRVLLGLKGNAILVEAQRTKRLICVRNPEDWKNIIQQGSKGEPMAADGRCGKGIGR